MGKIKYVSQEIGERGDYNKSAIDCYTTQFRWRKRLISHYQTDSIAWYGNVVLKEYFRVLVYALLYIQINPTPTLLRELTRVYFTINQMGLK